MSDTWTEDDDGDWTSPEIEVVGKRIQKTARYNAETPVIVTPPLDRDTASIDNDPEKDTTPPQLIPLCVVPFIQGQPDPTNVPDGATYWSPPEADEAYLIAAIDFLKHLPALPPLLKEEAYRQMYMYPSNPHYLRSQAVSEPAIQSPIS